MALTPDHAMRGDEASSSRSPNIRDMLAPTAGSAFARYRQLTCPGSLVRFCLFELATLLLLPLPGALGLLLRRILLKRFFGAMGRDVIIGRNCVFRHPQRIFIADGVVIDENCLIDARGSGTHGVNLASGVLLSRNVQIKSKGGSIYVGRGVNIGDNSVIVSQTGIWIGDEAAIAGNCQIMGGAFATQEFNLPASERTSTSAGPISIGSGCWLATSVVVLDAACVGDNSIVAAGSIVAGIVPAKSVAHGNPAKHLFKIR
jgi:acetyltransferase-like isoleucine patch superfamily enzyme